MLTHPTLIYTHQPAIHIALFNCVAEEYAIFTLLTGILLHMWTTKITGNQVNPPLQAKVHISSLISDYIQYLEQYPASNYQYIPSSVLIINYIPSYLSGWVIFEQFSDFQGQESLEGSKICSKSKLCWQSIPMPWTTIRYCLLSYFGPHTRNPHAYRVCLSVWTTSDLYNRNIVLWQAR